MANWLRALVGCRGKPKLTPSEQPPSLSHGELQGLRLDLAQREEEIKQLRASVARLRDRSDDLAQTASQAHIERLLADLSRPVGLLLALTAAPAGDGAPSEDVSRLLHQITQVLQDHGWQPVGEVGQVLPYDPALHQPLSQNESPQPGQPVNIRWPGGAYGGRVLLRAGVTLAERAEG